MRCSVGVGDARSLRSDEPLQLNTDLPWRSTGYHSLVVAGGTDGARRLQTSEILRLPDGRWQTGVALPCPLLSAHAVQAAGSVLLLGGEALPCSDALRYAPSAGTWVEVAPPNETTFDTVGGQAVTVVVGNESAVVVLGGRAVGSPTPSTSAAVFGFNTSSDSVYPEDTLFGVAVGAMPVARAEFGATFAGEGDGGVVVVAGGVGSEGGDPLARVDALDVATGQWRTAPAIPTATEGLAVVTVNGIVYAIGGAVKADGERIPTPAVHAIPFDFSAGWTSVANMTTARAFHAAVVIDSADGEKICVAGGDGLDGLLRSVECYDVATDSWEDVATMSVPRSRLVAFALHPK